MQTIDNDDGTRPVRTGRAYAIIWANLLDTRNVRKNTKLQSLRCVYPQNWFTTHCIYQYKLHCVSKKTTPTLHTITSAHINRFWYFWQRCCWVSTLLNG